MTVFTFMPCNTGFLYNLQNKFKRIAQYNMVRLRPQTWTGFVKEVGKNREERMGMAHSTIICNHSLESLKRPENACTLRKALQVCFSHWFSAQRKELADASASF